MVDKTSRRYSVGMLAVTCACSLDGVSRQHLNIHMLAKLLRGINNVDEIKEAWC